MKCLTNYMERNKLSKSALAFRCEIQPNDFAKYLDGRRLPRLTILERIALKLGIRLEELVLDALEVHHASRRAKLAFPDDDSPPLAAELRPAR